MPTLNARATALFGKGDLGIRWPYGMAPLRRTDTHETDEAFEERAADHLARQELMVAWAERYGLKAQRKGCCPLWLQGDTNRVCKPTAKGYACTRYGNTTPDRGWLDHAITWTQDRKPAAITAAPYFVNADTEARLDRWTQQDERLNWTRGAGWYGFSTTQLIVWRSDRIDDMHAA